MQYGAHSRLAIRVARPAEFADLARLTVEGYREYAGVMTPEGWAEYEADLADVGGRARDGATMLVAHSHGEPAGVVAYFPAGTRDWLPADWAYFRALAVLPTYRRQGLGQLLTGACIDRARSEGASALALHTTEGMPVARAMYERMGFLQQAEYEGSHWKYWLYAMPLGEDVRSA